MNISKAIEAKSDQLNAADLAGGPITVTIDRVTPGNQEQPVQIHLVERPGRPWRPAKNQLRILAEAWGSEETDDWPKGARVTLWRNPKVKWAGKEVGGIEVAALSHIPRELPMVIRESRDKTRPVRIAALTADAPATYTMPELASYDDARSYWTQRKNDGAGGQELQEIAAVGQALKAQEEPVE